MNPQQQIVYDKVASGPRGAVVGPMRAALHSPELADRWQSLGEFLRYNSSLSARLSELAILVCGRYWNSDVEWYIHSEAGRRAGLSDPIIDAIRQSRAPAFAANDEAVVYEFTRQLIQDGRVGDDAYEAGRDALGDVGVVELTALAGYYTMVAMTLNAHHVPAPDPNPPALRVLDAKASAAGNSPTRMPAADGALQSS